MITIDGDFVVVDNTETVTYQEKTTDSGNSYPNSQTCTSVLRRVLDSDFTGKKSDLKFRQIIFHIWADNITLVPKVNDRVKDSNNIYYTVKDVEIQSLQTRFKLTCVQEV